MRISVALALGSLILATAACATSQSGVSAGDMSGACDATKTQDLIGQPADSALAARALHLSGAATVRWLRPGQIVTMEYRANRLNIQLDERNKVVAIRCG